MLEIDAERIRAMFLEKLKTLSKDHPLRKEYERTLIRIKESGTKR